MSQCQCQRVLGDIDCVGAAVIGYGNAEAGAEVEIHMLVAGADELD